MITVFTPTYNRAHTISKLFDSLKKQTCTDFEWIVIDDDSSDNTEDLMKYYLSQNLSFPITYIKQPHGGKHRAINRGVKIAKGNWFFIVDSDDYITDNAIELIYKWIKDNEHDSKRAAVAGSRYEVNRKEQLSVPELLKLYPGLLCFNYDRCNYGLECDKAEIYRTELLKKHPFPEYEGEFFCTEAVCWDNIAYDGYYIAFYPDSIYLCEYMDDGLTKNDANGYTGFSNSFYSFLEYVKIEIKCHGFNQSTYGIIDLALIIAKDKKLSTNQLCKKIDISESEMNKYIKHKRRTYFVRKLRNIYNKIKLRNKI